MVDNVLVEGILWEGDTVLVEVGIVLVEVDIVLVEVDTSLRAEDNSKHEVNYFAEVKISPMEDSLVAVGIVLGNLHTDSVVDIDSVAVCISLKADNFMGEDN